MVCWAKLGIVVAPMAKKQHQTMNMMILGRTDMVFMGAVLKRNMNANQKLASYIPVERSWNRAIVSLADIVGYGGNRESGVDCGSRGVHIFFLHQININT